MLAKLPRNVLLNASQSEKYISDHIPLRDKLIDFYFESGLGVDFGTETHIVGKENYVFYTSVRQRNLHTLKVYQNNLMFSKKDISLFQKNFERIAQFAKANNIKVYLTIPPMNARVYHRFVPDYILRKNNPSVAEQVERAVDKIVTVVPIEKMLIEKSLKAKYPLIYKTDSHWSEDAGFEVYSYLMNFIQKDFKDVKPLSRADFKIEYINRVFSPYYQKPILTNGSTYLKGLDYGDVRYRHYVFEKSNKISEQWQKEFVFSHYADGLNHRVYVIGDSFAYYFLSFFKPTFKDVRFHRYNARDEKWGVDWKEREREMLEYKTDILILAPSDQKLEEFGRYFE